MPEKEKMYRKTAFHSFRLGWWYLAVQIRRSAVHREEGHGGSFDPQQQRTAGGLCLVEGVGNGDHQVYQNDQGVENVIGAADEVVRRTNVNNGADPAAQGLKRPEIRHNRLLMCR